MRTLKTKTLSVLVCDTCENDIVEINLATVCEECGEDMCYHCMRTTGASFDNSYMEDNLKELIWYADTRTVHYCNKCIEKFKIKPNNTYDLNLELKEKYKEIERLKEQHSKILDVLHRGIADLCKEYGLKNYRESMDEFFGK